MTIDKETVEKANRAFVDAWSNSDTDVEHCVIKTLEASGLPQRLADAEAREEKAWRERNEAYAKVKAWESVVYVQGLPLRSVRLDEWGGGEGEFTTVPEITPKKLTDLLDEIARLRTTLQETGK